MNTTALILPLVLVTTLSVIACDAGDAQPPREPTIEPASNMKIQLTLQGKTVIATLHDTPSARDFASMLPLTLALEDYSKTEKISDLPRKLTTKGAPAGADPSVGDIAYYVPWGNLALYYRDFRYSEGLILIGKLEGGAETLSVPGSVNVTIQLLGKDAPK